MFMPDHLHLLLEGQTDAADLKSAMRVLRQRLTVVFHDATKSTTPLWQDGYYERVLRGDESTEQTIRYLLANPVRAGLVANALDYPFGWSVNAGW
jgi:putative transposase